MSMTTPYGGLEDVASLQQKDLNVGTSLLNNSIGQYMQSAAIPVTMPGWGMEGFRNLQTQSPMGAVQMGAPAYDGMMRRQEEPSLMEQLSRRPTGSGGGY